MQVKFYLDTTVTRKDKTHPLRLYIYLSKKDRKNPFTEYASLPDDWDFEKEEPKRSHPLYLAIYDYLLEHRRKILKLLNSRERKSAEQIESYILGNSESIYSFWETRIEELKKLQLRKNNADLKKKGTAGKYEDNLNVFKNFKKELLYEDVNYNFLQKFKLKKSESCSPGGINTYIANLRAVYNEAVKRGLYTPENKSNPFDGIMEKEDPTKDKFLSIEEMKKLYINPIDHNNYRYFMLCFYLGGIDFIDIASMKKSDIKNNRIKFERAKGGTREVYDNFIFPEAQEILDYFNDPDSEYLTPIHKYSYDTYRKKYVIDFRKQIKEIGITSYTASKSPRYSFINIGGKELYLNRDIIKEITGHTQNDTHAIYEGKFPYHIKDKIHKEIIDSIKPIKNNSERKNESDQ